MNDPTCMVCEKTKPIDQMAIGEADVWVCADCREAVKEERAKATEAAQ